MRTLQGIGMPATTDSRVSCDRRTLRTRSALRDALAQEIQAVGDLSKVTVTAVTERAGVTRRTFYSHFRDIPDLVRQVEDETMADVRVLVANLVATNLDELQSALDAFGPCPGSEELLSYFKENGHYLAALLGKGGDPAFSQRIEDMVHEAVRERAADGLNLMVLGSVFDYYLTFSISAEVGVLVRWLTGGMREPVGLMARIMTMLMFVRPGDLYGKTIDLQIPSAALSMIQGAVQAAPSHAIRHDSHSASAPQGFRTPTTNHDEEGAPTND